MIIAAGVGENHDIVRAAQKVDFQVLLTESENELLEMLLKKEIDAAVRGSLTSSTIMAKIKKIYKEVYRASLLEVDGHKFLLAPVGIDEGDTLKQKENIILYGAQLLNEMGMNPKIAILSGGRSQDVGRSQKIDNSIRDAEELTRIIRDKYTVKHYFILIEDAVAQGSNLILAPDGICGNLIFRCLVFLGSIKSHGAINLGIKEILIDTSRNQTEAGYLRAVNLAKKLVELRQFNLNQV